MGAVYEGNGVTFTFSGFTLEPKTIELPGFTKEEINISTLSNSSDHTKFVAALRDWGKLFMTTPFDPTVYGALPTTEQALVISVPSEGSITYYAKISELDTVTLANDEEPVYRIGFSITNRNSGVETGPAFST